MRINHFIFVSCIFFIVSCSKKGQTITVIYPRVIDTMPLPNTVIKTDTLNVMAYNVLNYGDQCQGTLATLDGYLKTIIQYIQPDLLSCEKMYVFPLTPGVAGNLADEITDSVLNKVFPGRYAYAATSNSSGGGTMSVLFFNKQKLTYVKTETLESYITDFDLYKLYYNDINLSITHDTTFIYVVVNHTKSGSPSSSRDQQVSQEMTKLRSKFLYFPNLINLGDFNTASSTETGYQVVVTSTDSTTIMYDPPYSPDSVLHYPGYWDASPNATPSYLTTSTRALATVPNSCGTSGGAKGWYDHIFISPWIVNGTNFIKYIPGSYKTIGNDGNRVGIDINDSTSIKNTAAPDSVIEALFQFSNKYPIMIKLSVKANRSAAGSVADPVERN
jgi:hypothetical protein